MKTKNKKNVVQQASDAVTNHVACKIADAMWKNNCKGKKEFLKKTLVVE